MDDRFGNVIQGYEDSFREHGDSPAALFWGKGRQALRFHVLAPLLQADAALSVCDYGCGLAHLLPYLRSLGWRGYYHGVDIVPAFIEHDKGRQHDNASFELIAPDQNLTGQYGVVFVSGVFNIQTHDDMAESKAYVFRRLENLFSCATAFFVSDFMTDFVDFQQEGAQHFSPKEIIDLAVSRLSRRFILRHDILPYEFTLICYRDAAIERPANVYAGKETP